MDTLRDYRKSKGWTTAKLAVEVGVSTASVEHWESGRSAPRSRHLLRLAELFDVSPVVMLDAVESVRKVESADG